ncbi:chitooligosaccharidolytic beta-N-acetylglucosaminidase [Toxorhynchites rutilus septentrionalis]|uniref:chitooligosaccharidolytic beta-N-acetylglucosaminidase n=1 Tax=Toxorhynchites rutilus septentrionalis TaxID=329112 RepID=UPI002478E6EA|nr:chitooligosaccharidolytic beta-N-acetylglucosaminidase [Toxorhynchites rutilus septentrionalis]
MRAVNSKACSFLAVVTVCVVIVKIAIAVDRESISSLYKFRCFSGKCLRQHQDYLNESEQYFDSLNECRLVCGEYSALWPIPTGEFRLSHETTEILPGNVRFDNAGTPEDRKVKQFLNETQKIFIKNLFRECGRSCNRTSASNVLISTNIQATETSLSWQTNESYELHVSTQGSTVEVAIIANTVFGARHALESLSQLTTAKQYRDGNCLLILTEAHISDSPVFPHRGLLLDTARNFISLKAIRRQLDGMASTKMNVLHWHITDSQSFPLELVSFPQVTFNGAYSERHIYKQKDVRQIFEYARYRGIRVILEFDAPAHAGNGWQWTADAGLGNISVCLNEQPWRKLCIEPPCGQLNPANPNLYNVLQEVYADFASLIPTGEIIHMGGDEVFFGCWNATQEIVDYLASHRRGREQKDFLDLWGEFQRSVLKLWDRSRSNEPLSPTILWSSHLTDPEVIETYLSKDRYIVQTWVEESNELPKQLLKKGYRLIISTKNAWYFDHGFWGVTNYYGWRKVYNNKILKNSLILGGEACIWTEFIDEHSLDSRTWPRLAAVGERLWADPQIDASKVEGRFYRQRDRLITRGINPEAVTPQWCVQNEDECR